jgi:hypothetical protein
VRSALVQHVAGASSDVAATSAAEHAGYVGEAAEYSGGVEEMKWAVVIAAMLVTRSVSADCAPDDFECGLSVVELGQTPSAAPRLKSQLVERDTKTPKVIGAVSGIAGGLSLVAAWTLYIARQNTRLEPRYTVTADDVSHWEALGTWNLGLAAGGAAGLIAAEYLLLPPSDSVPFFAWLGGAAGLGGAAIGAGYLLGASSCAPIAIGPGAQVPQACLSGVADKMFGVTLLLTAAPLLNLPFVYLLRDAFSGPAESLTLSPTGISGKF